MSSWLWLECGQSIDHIDSILKTQSSRRGLTSCTRQLIHAEAYLHRTPGASVGARDSGFILRVFRAMQLYGYPAHTLEETLIDVSRTPGQTTQFFTTPTAVMAAFGLIDQHELPSST